MAVALVRSPAAWIQPDVSTVLQTARQDSATTSPVARYALLGTAAALLVVGCVAGAFALRGSRAGAAPDPLALRVARVEAALAEAQQRRCSCCRACAIRGRASHSRAATRPLHRRRAAVAVRGRHAAPLAARIPGDGGARSARSTARPLAEVCSSHAARGLPTEAELRERYAVLVPQLIARAPRDANGLGRTLSAIRGAASSIGFASPPPPSDQEQAIAGVGAAAAPREPCCRRRRCRGARAHAAAPSCRLADPGARAPRGRAGGAGDVAARPGGPGSARMTIPPSRTEAALRHLVLGLLACLLLVGGGPASAQGSLTLRDRLVIVNSSSTAGLAQRRLRAASRNASRACSRRRRARLVQSAPWRPSAAASGRRPRTCCWSRAACPAR